MEDNQDEARSFVEAEADGETYERVTADDYVSQEELGGLLASLYEVPNMGHDTPLTNCAVCHR